MIYKQLYKDTACGRAGNPSHLPRQIVILSPDLAGSTDVGTDTVANVAKLFLKPNAKRNKSYNSAQCSALTYKKRLISTVIK